MKQGRPLRFLVLVLAGWTAARMAMLAPATPPAVAAASVRPLANPTAEPTAAAARPALAVTQDRPSREWTTSAARISRARAVTGRVPTTIRPDPVAAAPPSAAIAPSAPTSAWRTPGPAPLPPSLSPTRRRLRIDGWLLARAGGAGTPLTPQLGGSQAGVRLAYALGRGGRLAAFARAAAPLGAGDPEVAAGVQYRLPGTPLTAFVEARKVAGRPLAPGVGIFGGIDRRFGRWRLAGYGQGGYAAGPDATVYADGQLGLTRPLARLGTATLSGGAGAWGAAQRGAARLDLGPGIALAHGPVRFGLDWRLRVAGDARPGSGPALTLGGSF